MILSEFLKTNGFSIFVLIVATVALILSIVNMNSGSGSRPTLLAGGGSGKKKAPTTQVSAAYQAQRNSTYRKVSKCPGWKCSTVGHECTAGPGYICKDEPNGTCTTPPCWHQK